MKFDPLFLSPQWLKEYNTKYPHGMSVLENIIEWLNKVNELIDWVNITPEKVAEILEEWKVDGTIAALINQVLFDTKADKTALEADIADLESRSYNVKNYGAKGDGVTDDAPAINALITSIAANGGTLFFPNGNYRLETPIQWTNHIHLKGSNGAVLRPVGTAIQASLDIRSAAITDLTLIGPESYQAGSKGIAFHEDNGGWMNMIKNVEIWNFEYGVYARDIWWHNTLENVFCTNNKHALYIVYKNVGSNINNTFINFYADKPTNYPIMLSSARRLVFINPSIDTTTFPGAIYADLNCEVEIIGGNLEGSDLQNGQSIILIGPATKFSADGLNITPFSVISGEGYALNVDGVDALVTLNNCMFHKVAGMRQIRTAYKNGIKILNNSPQIDDYYNATGDGAPGGQYITQYHGKTGVGNVLNLSGGPAECVVSYSTTVTRVVKAAILYDEATDGNAGIPVELFYTGSNGYDLVLGSVTTAVNKDKGSLSDLTMQYYKVPAGIPIRARTAGNKSGTGKVTMLLEYVNE